MEFKTKHPEEEMNVTDNRSELVLHHSVSPHFKQ